MWTALSATLAILLISSTLLVISACCFRIVRVAGQSMQPTLHDGERLLMMRCFPARRLRSGQIVTLNWTAMLDRDVRHAPELADARLAVKRLLGLPGDWMLIPANGASAERRDAAADILPAGCRQLQVPAGHCFLGSDNPTHGTDSRQWGCLPLRAISSVMVARLNAAAPRSTDY